MGAKEQLSHVLRITDHTLFKSQVSLVQVDDECHKCFEMSYNMLLSLHVTAWAISMLCYAANGARPVLVAQYCSVLRFDMF